ncbi:MAG TPA: ClpXP protease specificity-enhancing factor [Gammaproteobacteria bacterium]|nr:ClpXP protease specificity-enhancing factor [Gammaproteobacteria bacterium]
MTSSRPYLLKALNLWIHDNGMTPHIVVDVTQKDVIVPQEFVSSGKIVLNLSPSAVHGLTIDNDFMCFSARFSGRAMDVIVPVPAVMAIYAKENGQGMVFSTDGAAVVEKPPISKPDEKLREKPSLRLVQ